MASRRWALSLLNSTVSDNTAVNIGGILSVRILTITGSTISGNIATGASSQGGGVFQSGSIANVTNSTFADNEANQGGAWFQNGGTLNINSSTISRNISRDTSSSGGAGVVSKNTFTLGNSILSGNIGYDWSRLAGTFHDNGYNIVGNYAAVTAPPIASTTRTGITNPGLAALGNYGGPTQTMALLPGSAALNSGNPALVGTFDQRGVQRSDGNPDIGAYESRGFAYIVAGGNNQSAVIGTAFAQPLVVSLVALDPGLTDFTGASGTASITLMVPGSGPTASGVLTKPIVVSGGTASATFTLTAAEAVGTYHVVVAGVPSGGVFFTLTNLGIPVSILADAGQGKTFGEADPITFGYSIGGGAPGLMLKGVLLRAPGEAIDLYSFDISNLAALNPIYIVTLDPSSPVFAIRPASITPLPPTPPGPSPVETMDLTAFNATRGRNNLNERDYLYIQGTYFKISYEGETLSVPSLLHLSSQEVIPETVFTPSQP
ncbi:MAG: choice-of-anchor Q domain-containing protein [Candidatus Methylacidiphilales bacterium]